MGTERIAGGAGERSGEGGQDARVRLSGTDVDIRAGGGGMDHVQVVQIEPGRWIVISAEDQRIGVAVVIAVNCGESEALTTISYCGRTSMRGEVQFQGHVIPDVL